MNDERYWLSAAVDPATNRLLHVRLYPTRTTAIAETFLAERREQHRIGEAPFLVDSSQWLRATLPRHGFRFYHATKISKRCFGV